MDPLLSDHDVPSVAKIFCFLPLLLFTGLVLLVRVIISLLIDKLLFGLLDIDV